MTLEEIRMKTKVNKEERLKRIGKICGTDGNYKKNRVKPRAKEEQAILDMFAAQGYY